MCYPSEYHQRTSPFIPPIMSVSVQAIYVSNYLPTTCARRVSASGWSLSLSQAVTYHHHHNYPYLYYPVLFLVSDAPCQMTGLGARGIASTPIRPVLAPRWYSNRWELCAFVSRYTYDLRT